MKTTPSDVRCALYRNDELITELTLVEGAGGSYFDVGHYPLADNERLVISDGHESKDISHLMRPAPWPG